MATPLADTLRNAGSSATSALRDVGSFVAGGVRDFSSPITGDLSNVGSSITGALGSTGSSISKWWSELPEEARWSLIGGGASAATMGLPTLLTNPKKALRNALTGALLGGAGGLGASAIHKSFLSPAKGLDPGTLSGIDKSRETHQENPVVQVPTVPMPDFMPGDEHTQQTIAQPLAVAGATGVGAKLVGAATRGVRDKWKTLTGIGRGTLPSQLKDIKPLTSSGTGTEVSTLVRLHDQASGALETADNYNRSNADLTNLSKQLSDIQNRRSNVMLQPVLDAFAEAKAKNIDLTGAVKQLPAINVPALDTVLTGTKLDRDAFVDNNGVAARDVMERMQGGIRDRLGNMAKDEVFKALPDAITYGQKIKHTLGFGDITDNVVKRVAERLKAIAPEAYAHMSEAERTALIRAAVTERIGPRASFLRTTAEAGKDVKGRGGWLWPVLMGLTGGAADAVYNSPKTVPGAK